MQKIIDLLIVENNKLLSEYIKLALRKADDINIIGIVNNGEEALQFLSTNSPDIMLLDIIMPKMDGIEVLKNIPSLNLKKLPKIIVLSSISESSIIKSTIESGADYYILKPFDADLLIKRIKYLSEENYSNFLSIDIKEVKEDNQILKESFKNILEIRITDLLNQLQIAPKNMGYGYIRAAIIESYNNDSFLTQLSKNLYPVLSEKFKVSPKKVERAIRNSINSIWEKGILQNSSIFANSIFYSGEKKPTNLQFISILLKRLREINE